MSSTKINIFFNFAGKLITAILSIIFVPIYLSYLSVELYGIIGFFTSVQAFLSILDGGISPTLNREVARLSAFPENARKVRNLVRTLEILCWGLSGLVCIIAILCSPFIANYWLQSQNISKNVINQSLIILSLTFAFQWTLGFYAGGLLGLQEQKLLNFINIIIALFRSVGAFIVLAYFSATIQAFLIWQLISNAINCFLVYFVFWAKLPKLSERPRYNFQILKEVWKYATGMTGISLVVLISSQIDKIILSKMLSLEDFGYYTLAVTLATTGIGVITGSISNVYFPQFSQLVAQKKFAELRDLYHRGSQVMSLFLIPTVTLLAGYSFEVLFLWTKNIEIAQKTYILLSLIAIGSGLNGLMHIPYHMQLAFGITKIAILQNVFAIILLIPFLIYTTFYFGAVGGALTWMLSNLLFVTVGLQIMNRFILNGELKRWYLEDVGLPLLTVVVTFTSLYFSLFFNFDSFYLVFVKLLIILLLVFVVSALSLPIIRKSIFFHLNKVFKA